MQQPNVFLTGFAVSLALKPRHVELGEGMLKADALVVKGYIASGYMGDMCVCGGEGHEQFVATQMTTFGRIFKACLS